MDIAALQINVSSFDKVEQLTQGLQADLLILPEVFEIGWYPEKFAGVGVNNGEKTVKFLSGLAKTLGINIIGGSYIAHPLTPSPNGRGKPKFNRCPVFNRRGELVAQYDKMHLFRFDGEEKYITAGKNPVMVELDGVKIGLTICYDIRFPEIYRAYAKAGADLFVNVAAWGKHKPVQWEVMTRSRAAENQIPLVALTLCGGDNLGHSRIIGADGEILAEIKDDEGIIRAAIDFDKGENDAAASCFAGAKFGILGDIQENYEVKYEKAD